MNIDKYTNMNRLDMNKETFENQLQSSVRRRKQAEKQTMPRIKAQNPIAKSRQTPRLTSHRVWRSVAGVAVVVVLGLAIVQPWRREPVAPAVEMQPITKTVTQVPDTAIPMKSFRQLYEEYARYMAMLRAQQKSGIETPKTMNEQAADFQRFLSMSE